MALSLLSKSYSKSKLIVTKRSSSLQSHPYVPQLTHSVADTLESWRQEHLGLPVLTWKAFHEKVRTAVNPLVSEDQLRDITNSLHKMGEVGVVYT